MATKQTGFAGIIEEPSSYHSMETWERHLARIKAMDFAPDAVPGKALMMRSAREMMELKKRVEREIEDEGRRAKRA